MYPLRVWIPTNMGIFVPTSEHKYMADRLLDPDLHEQVALARGQSDDARVYKDGLAAKQLAHEFFAQGAQRCDESIVARLGLMHVAVQTKFFANRDIAHVLKETGTEEIVEGNTWEDRFWGVDPPGSTNGNNHLGKILMRVRTELIL